ncbi:hypothetical protein C9374_005564 [Naegleria lovaniensis]|uniref:Regulator of chromosome condensation domain-containing protein n=1 Tax=Naegleria lovaniensis TaxID=51637 RepID=A0AA88GPZ4_NAELO|nr:uncharacterized protein C9374_005564 [Naegleria lovaniensis]KAG2382362.1 hypothetical protein C9374_005564 [Naegleria lovaniensis]
MLSHLPTISVSLQNHDSSSSTRIGSTKSPKSPKSPSSPHHPSSVTSPLLTTSPLNSILSTCKTLSPTTTPSSPKELKNNSSSLPTSSPKLYLQNILNSHHEEDEEEEEEESSWNIHIRGFLHRYIPHRSSFHRDHPHNEGSEPNDTPPSCCHHEYNTESTEIATIKGMDQTIFPVSSIRRVFAFEECSLLVDENDRICIFGNLDDRFEFNCHNLSNRRRNTEKPSSSVTSPPSSYSTTSVTTVNPSNNHYTEQQQQQTKRRKMISIFNKKNTSMTITDSVETPPSTTSTPSTSRFKPSGSLFVSMREDLIDTRPMARNSGPTFQIFKKCSLGNTLKISCIVLKFNSIMETIHEIVLGSKKHFFLLTENGRVYAMGENEDGRLGLGDDIEFVASEPMMVDLYSHKIRKIVASECHTFFLTYDGGIFACGKNLGFNGMYLDLPAANVFTPLRLTQPSISVDKMVGFGESLLFLTQEENALFSYGLNIGGMLATGNNLSIIGCPTRASYFYQHNEIIDDVFAVNGNSIFVTQSNKIYVCGKSVSTEKPLCIFDIGSLEVLEQFSIRKVVDGDGYGNILLFLTNGLDLYSYYYESASERHVFEKVYFNVTDISSYGRNIVFISNTFSLTYCDLTVNINREAMTLMKIFSSDALSDNKIIEWTIRENDLFDNEKDAERPLKLVAKFCNQFQINRKKKHPRRYVSFTDSIDYLDQFIDTKKNETNANSTLKNIWHTIALSFNESESAILRYLIEQLKLELLLEILDVPFYLRQIERDSDMLSFIKKQKKYSLIADTYFTYHKEKGNDHQWDKIFFEQHEEDLLKLLTIAFEYKIQTLSSAIFNYLRWKLQANSHTSPISKIEKLEYASTFNHLQNNFSIWFSLQRKKNIVFKKKKTKPMDHFLATVLMFICQKLMDSLPPLSVKHTGKTYRNFLSLNMDLSPIQVAESLSKIKRLKEDITELLNKKGLVQKVSKKRHLEFQEIMIEYCKGIRFNDLFNSLCEQSHAIHFLIRYCICNCFTEKQKWIIDENKTTSHIANRRAKIHLPKGEVLLRSHHQHADSFVTSAATHLMTLGFMLDNIKEEYHETNRELTTLQPSTTKTYNSTTEDFYGFLEEFSKDRKLQDGTNNMTIIPTKQQEEEEEASLNGKHRNVQDRLEQDTRTMKDFPTAVMTQSLLLTSSTYKDESVVHSSSTMDTTNNSCQHDHFQEESLSNNSHSLSPEYICTSSSLESPNKNVSIDIATIQTRTDSNETNVSTLEKPQSLIMIPSNNNNNKTFNLSPEYYQALEYAQELFFIQNMAIFKVRRMAKAKYPTLSNQELSKMYIELATSHLEKKN